MLTKVWKEREDLVKRLNEKDKGISIITKDNIELAKKLDKLEIKVNSTGQCKECPRVKARLREITDKVEEFAATITNLKTGVLDDHLTETRLKRLKGKNLEDEDETPELISGKQQASENYKNQMTLDTRARKGKTLFSKDQQERPRYLELWEEMFKSRGGNEQYHNEENCSARYSHPGEGDPAWVREH